MPVHVSKVDGYRVSHGGKVSAKKTSLRNAMAQKRLLQGVEHGFKPTGQSKNPHQSEKSLRTMAMKMRSHKGTA